MTRFLSVSGAPGDRNVAAETTTAFGLINEATEVFADLARLRFFYSAIEEVAELTAVRQAYFPPRFPEGDFPAATGVITGGRPDGPALTMQAVVAPGGRRVQPPSLWSAVAGHELPVSHGIAVDNVLFVSGQVPYDHSAQLVGDDPCAQIDQALANLETVMSQSDVRYEDVLGFTVYLVAGTAADDRHAREHFDARVAQFSTILAPVAWVGVQALFQAGLLVEIEATVSLAGQPVRVGGSAATTTSPSAAAAKSVGWAYATAVIDFDDAQGTVRRACHGLSESLALVGGDLGVPALITAWTPDRTTIQSVSEALTAELPDAVTTVVPLAAPTGSKSQLVIEALTNQPH